MKIYFIGKDENYKERFKECIDFFLTGIKLIFCVNTNDLDKNDIDVLIIDTMSIRFDEIDKEILSNFTDKFMLLLIKNERKKENGNLNEWESSIFERCFISRYSTIEEWVYRLNQVDDKVNLTFACDLAAKKTKLVLVSSIEGGCGCSSVALGISQYLSRYENQKVLYFSLENFISHTLGTMQYDILSKTKIYKPLSSILLSLMREDRNAVIKFLKTNIITDNYGIFRFLPDKGINSINMLNKKEILELLEQIDNVLGVDIIVVDYGILDLSIKQLLMNAKDKFIISSLIVNKFDGNKLIDNDILELFNTCDVNSKCIENMRPNIDSFSSEMNIEEGKSEIFDAGISIDEISFTKVRIDDSWFTEIDLVNSFKEDICEIINLIEIKNS